MTQRLYARVDDQIEKLAERVAESVPPLLHRHRLAGDQGHLESAQQPNEVVGMYACRERWVEAVVPASQRAWRTLLEPREDGTQRRPGGRGGEQPSCQRAEVEARTADDDRQLAARRHFADQRPREVTIASRVEPLRGVGDVEQVVGNPVPVLRRRLRGADVEMA